MGLPIYLHLLRRHKTDPQPFSSLMFFERRTQSSVKYRRLRHLLLLSLRIAVLLLLALAFANPFISRTVAGLGGNKLVLLVVDNSFSMRAGPRLTDAKGAAISVLASKNPGTDAQVMTLGSQLQALTPQTQEMAELRAAVEGIQPGDSRASFGELARALRAVAETVRTPIELHFFSDFQKSNQPASFQDMTLPPNVTLVLHPVAKAVVANWAVESVAAPGQVWDPKKARVTAVIAGFHTPLATRTVSLLVNGHAIASRNASVPADGRASVVFDSLDVPYGFSRCEVAIDSADSLNADDHYVFSVERTDPRRVLFVHEADDSRSPLYFRSALASAAESAFTVETAAADQAANTQPSQYAFIVLSDVASIPTAYEQALVNYVRGGGSLLIALGTSAVRHPHIPVFGGGIQNSHYYSRGPQRFLSVSAADPTFPSIAKADRWADVDFYFAAQADAANSRVVASLSDGTPLLLEKKIGEGRVLLFTSGLDNLTNDFPMHPSFVPFVEQTALYLSGEGQRSGSRVVDSFIDLRAQTDHAASVEVVDPDGHRPLSLQEAASTQSFRLSRAGFYELRLANGRHDVVGVNADRRESDLDVVPDEVLALWKGNSAAPDAKEVTGGARGAQKTPIGVWWYVMLGLLAAAVVESLVSDRYLGKQREEP